MKIKTKKDDESLSDNAFDIPNDDNSNDFDMPIDANDDLNNQNDEIDNKFDSNFDAGVEADEDDDPKRYIQQLTGKLSQKLRDYNETQGESDADLNKYVAGMIVKQAVNGLDDSDKKEIIDKINNDSNDDSNNDSNDDSNQSDFEDIESNGMDNLKNESKYITCTKKQLNTIKENFGANNDILNSDEKRSEKKITKFKKNELNKPFIAPSFK